MKLYLPLAALVTRTGATLSPASRDQLRARWVLGSILLGSMALRIPYALAPHVAFSDESYYLFLARGLFESGSYSYYAGRPELHFPPLFPILLGVLHWIIPSWEVVTRIAYVIFGGLIPLPVYTLGSRMYGRRVGALAGLLAAVIPAFTSGLLLAESLSEPLFLFLLFCGVDRLHAAWIDRRPRDHVFAGALLSLSYLTRPEALVHAFAGGVLLLLCVPYLPWRIGLRRAALAAAMGGSFLLLAAPYMFYLHRHTGAWQLTTKSVTSFTTTRGLVRNEKERFSRETDGLDDQGEIHFYAPVHEGSLFGLVLGQYRGEILEDLKLNFLTLRKLLHQPRLFGSGLLLLAVVGLLGGAWSRWRLHNELFNGVLLLAVAPVLLFFVRDRLLYPALLPLIFWVACGVQHLLFWIRTSALPGPLSSTRSRSGLQTAALCVLVGSLLWTGQERFAVGQAERSHVWPTADWLREHLPPRSRIMSNSSEVVFHSDNLWIPLPNTSLERALEFGRRREAEYLCVQARFCDSRPQQRTELFVEARTRPGLELLVKKDDPAAGSSFVVYRLMDPPPAASPVSSDR